MGCHDSSQVIPLHQEFVLVLATLLVNVNDSSGNLRDPLNHHLIERGGETRKEYNILYAFPSVGTCPLLNTFREIYIAVALFRVI